MKNYVGLMYFIFFFHFSHAQNSFNNYSISKLTPDDGLSQGSNYFKHEDSHGFMWLTCNDALNRFDGKTVKVYNLDKYFDNCPNLQQGYGFAEDKHGNIYIGSVRGLYIYNRKKDQFTLQKIFNTGVDDLAMPIGFYDGKIWCFNKQYQLATFDVKTKQTKLVSQLPLTPLKSIHIYEMSENIYYYHFPFIDKSGNVWIINNTEILKFETKTQKSFFSFKAYFSDRLVNFYAASFDNLSNRLYLGTSEGLFEYSFKDNKITEIKNKEVSYDAVFGLAAKGDIKVFRTLHHVYFLNRKNDVVMATPINNENKNLRLFGYSFDKSGRLWVCDDGKGQLIFDFFSKILPKIPNDNTPSKYSNLSGINRFEEFSTEEIVIPTSINNNNLLVFYNHKTGQITDIPSIISRDNTAYFELKFDNKRNGIWFFYQNTENGKTSTNIAFLNQDKKIIHHKINNNFDEIGSIQDLMVFEKGEIICAFSSGLYQFKPLENKLVKVNMAKQKNLFKINKLDNNHLAISAINNDMILYELKADNSLKFIKKILPKIQSFYIQKDKKRHIYWVGTNQGVYLLDKDFKILKVFNANNKLAGTYIYGLLLDDDGNIYCSHQRGISSIDANTFQVTNYDKNDGIQDWDFNNRAFYKAKDGTLFFGGASGFNYFKPPLKPYSYYKPTVYIDEILVKNKNICKNTNANNIQTLKLNHEQNDISIHAIVKDLAHAHSRLLIYKIKGKNSNWKYLPNATSINFINLAPNNYTLQLGYYDKYSNKAVFQKTLFISIAAPFYTKAWFLSLLVFTLTLIVFWFYNKRKLKLQEYAFNQQLELEKQRSKITADLHDDIGSTLSSLQINSAVANQLIDKNSKEAKKVLEKIETQAEQLSDKIGDIIWSMKPGKEEFLSLTTRIKNFTNDIMGSTDIDYTLNLDETINDQLTDITIRKNIILFIKEAINNAAKYSGAKQFSINIYYQNENIMIEIADNGVGFDPIKTNGNGIGNMKKRIEELNGTFTLNSDHFFGTSIKATIPVVP